MEDKKLHITIGVESSTEEFNEVRTIFESDNYETDMSAGFVRASANDLPMYIMVIAQGLATNALWDTIKLAVTKIRSSNVLNSRRRPTQITIRRKKFTAVILGKEFQVQSEKENASFNNIDDFIKYAKTRDTEDDEG
jgi:hypothetical protein